MSTQGRIRLVTGFVASATLLASCSGTTTGTSSGSSPGRAGTSPGSASTTSPLTPTPSTTTTVPVGPGPKITVNKTISDPALGHTVTIHQIQRHWPWPANYGIASDVFELVAVDMTWEAGTVYTAWLSPDMFTISSGGKFPNLADSVINTSLANLKYPLMPAKVLHGKKVRGWVVFKVDPKDAKALSLTYNRPKIQVTGGDAIAAKTFTVPLVK
jgi:hypothetical protein